MATADATGQEVVLLDECIGPKTVGLFIHIAADLGLDSLGVTETTVFVPRSIGTIPFRLKTRSRSRRPPFTKEPRPSRSRGIMATAPAALPLLSACAEARLAAATGESPPREHLRPCLGPANTQRHRSRKEKGGLRFRLL